MMDRRQAISLIVVGTALVASDGTSASPRVDLSSKVKRLADAYAAAWNASDMDAMAALYTDDVHWVNIVGMHWQGKRQVDQAHRAYLELMFKGVPLSMQEIESIVPLPSGGAVAVIRWTVGAFKTPTGQLVPPSRDRMSLMLVPAGERLLIAHGANVQIDEMAQNSDPIAMERHG